MEDFESFAWIVWCILLSAIIFYIFVQIVRYCTNMIKIAQESSDEPPSHIPQVDFVISPVYTVSRGAALMANHHQTVSSNCDERLQTTTPTAMVHIDEKSKNNADGLPSYEEAMRIVMSATAPVLSVNQSNQINSPGEAYAQPFVNPNFVK